MSHLRASSLAVLAFALATGCRREGDDVTVINNTLFRGTLTFTANGGTSSGALAFSTGGPGGDLTVDAQGNIFVGVNPPPLAPAVPATPVTGAVVDSWTDVAVVPSGNALVNGDITAGSTGSTATLSVNGGDLVINGSITSADNGGNETDLVLIVPAGTVWIHGTLRTGRVDGTSDGDHGGDIEIRALRIIFTGTIDTRGESATGVGGNGGSVSFDTEGTGTAQTSQLLVRGTMDLSGGNASGAGAVGGSAGTFLSYIGDVSNGAVHINGTTVAMNGGSATGTGEVTGGFGGYLDLQGNGGVFFSGAFTSIGGSASSTDGDAIAGDSGGFYENDLAAEDSGPCSVFGTIDVSGGSASAGPGEVGLGGRAGFITVDTGSDANLGAGTCSLRGGDSSGSGGEGGTSRLFVVNGFAGDIFFDAGLDVSDGSGGSMVQGAAAGDIEFGTWLGDIQISGALVANGGHGSGAVLSSGPTDGGSVLVVTGDNTGDGGGSITLRGSVQANGGLDNGAADANSGGRGGAIRFECANIAGSVYLDPGSSIQADGGAGGGPDSLAVGGDGGTVLLLTSGGSVAGGTNGGNVSLRGAIFARGGAGPNVPSSIGGFGGQVAVLTDDPSVLAGGGDGRGGDIELLAGATIDVSAGPGDFGGDALNDFAAGVTNPVAVIFDADGNESDNPIENGIVMNQGSIAARGAPVMGYGGDVLFDGLTSALSVGPLPGVLDLSGAGGSPVGDFLSQ